MLRLRTRLVGSLGFVFLFAALAGSSFGQQIFGSIIGTVTDPSGSPVANARVVVTETNKGTSSEVTTNGDGQYTRGQLIPGTYKVTVESAGFSKVASNDITVSVDRASQFNATMQVGNVNQTVEVTAAAPLLQTDRADVAQTFSAQELNALPNIGRNVQSFELLNPGTVRLAWNHASSENPQGSVQTMVNGQLFSATGYELDGTVNQDPILGIIVVNPTMDSVNEVKQANQNYDAEFSYMGGGLLTYSTKSGANQFHGDAFEYLFLNTPGFQDFGRNPFNSAENTGVPTDRQNQFGGSIGGRVIKDKLFFFADTQLTRRHQGGSLVTTVPTAQERGMGQPGGNPNLGDWLSASPTYQIYDPATGSPNNRAPFANNIIPASRVDPRALALLNYFPMPNTVEQGTGYAFRNNYSTSGTDILANNQWNTRWDYYANERNSFFGRYSYAGYTQNAPAAFGDVAGGPSFPIFGFAGNSDALNQSIAGGWTHTANPSLINEFRFGYMRYRVVVTPGGLGTSPASDVGIPNLNKDDFYTSGMPAFYIHEPGGADQGIGGSTQLGYGLSTNRCNCPLTEREQQYQFIDNVSKITGNHNLKFGADIRYALNLRVPSDSHRAGEVGFDPLYTGQVTGNSSSGGLGLASFLLGQATSFSRYVSSSTDAQERQKRLFFYGQDQWRVTPKLTFSYGLRWEMVFPETVNAPGNGAALNLNTGLMEVFGTGLVSNHGYQNMNWHNFAPRVGLAYQITPKTVVRAGYGWSYSLGTFGSTFGHNVTQNPPVLANQNINRAQNFQGVFDLATGPADPATTAVSANGTFPLPDGIAGKARPSNFTMPVVYTYNAFLEQQVTNKISVSAGYVGNSGRHNLLGTGNSFNVNEPAFINGFTNVVDNGLNLSRPYAGLNPSKNFGWTQNIDYYCNCSNSRYDSLQAIVKVSGWAGYNVQGSYTYQVSQGDGWGSDPSYTFLYNRPLGYGNSDFIPHHQFVAAQNYAIPFGRGRRWGNQTNRFVDLALGGWNLSGITSFYSGVPFNPTIGTYPADYSRPNAGPNDRPDIGTGSPYAGSSRNRDQWFTGGFGGAFALPAANTFGNYPINQLYGPRFINQDASLSKTFTLTERFKFTLRADATNFFNHTNLDVPSNKDVSSPSVGVITGLAFGGQYQMRRLQYSGTINW